MDAVTIQYLPQPPTDLEEVLFFSADWRLLGPKGPLVDVLSRITGIHKLVLRGAELTTVSVAQRMSSVSQRTTSRVEYLAYCLLGLLGVNMPLLYGEGSKAFQKLQEEILKLSNDHSLFVWYDSNPSKSRFSGLLANSPSQFRDFGDVYALKSAAEERPYRMTNQGLEIPLPIWQEKSEDESLPNFPYCAALSCFRQGEQNRQVVLMLEHLQGDQFARALWAPPRHFDLQAATT